MEKIIFEPIGYIESPFKKKGDAPPQSVQCSDKKAIIHIEEKYIDGLKSLETFSHIIVIFYCHKVKDFDLLTGTPWDNEKRGVFATRTPRRPNPIGISIVELSKINGNSIEISGVDMFDRTPVIDIKPYTSDLNPEKANKGWMEQCKIY